MAKVGVEMLLNGMLLMWIVMTGGVVFGRGSEGLFTWRWGCFEPALKANVSGLIVDVYWCDGVGVRRTMLDTS